MAQPGLPSNLCSNGKAYFLFQSWGTLSVCLLSMADQRHKPGKGHIAW